jgi:pimeloyl-ACP methyl ester carboxylesterase
MTTISSATTTVAGVGIRAEHLTGEAHMGLPVERGGGRADAALDAVLRRVGERTDGAATLTVRAELTVHPTWPSLGPSRDGGPVRVKDEAPRLLIEGPPLDQDEVAQIAVVEEEGLLRFVLPVEGTPNTFAIPLGDSLASDRGTDRGTERGISFRAAALAIRVIGVLGGRKAVNAGLRSAVRLIEDKARPRGLRTFSSDGFRDKPDDRSAVTFSSGPSALLLLHGANSSSHSCFRFPTDLVKLLDRRYGGRVLAFDHPTLGYSPRDNAADLAERLASFRLDNVDILAHSRGGLVAREFVAEPPAGVNVRSIVHVATPNGGTPLADAGHLGQFLSVATNLIGLIPDNPVTDVLGIVLDVLREWVLEPVGELPGIAAMKPDSTELTELNGGSQPRLVQRAVASSFEPGPNQGALLRLRDLITDQVFVGVDNDLLVPTRSTYRRSGQFHIPVGRRLVLDTTFTVSHSQFWTEPQVTSLLERWLDPTADADEVDDVPAKLTDPAAELDDAMATSDVDAMRRAINVLGSDKIGSPTCASTVRSRWTSRSPGWCASTRRSSRTSTARGTCSRSRMTGASRSRRARRSSLRAWSARVWPSAATDPSTSSVTPWAGWWPAPSSSSIAPNGPRAAVASCSWARPTGDRSPCRWRFGARSGSSARSPSGTSSTTRRRSSTPSRRSRACSSSSRHPNDSCRGPPRPSTRSSTNPRHGRSAPRPRSRPASRVPARSTRPARPRGSTAWSTWPATTRRRRSASGSIPTSRSASA